MKRGRSVEKNVMASFFGMTENVLEKRLRSRIPPHLDNASPHTGIEILAHPPYRSDLAPCNLHLFPRINEKLLGKGFTDAEVVVAAYRKAVEATKCEWTKCEWAKWWRMVQWARCSGAKGLRKKQSAERNKGSEVTKCKGHRWSKVQRNKGHESDKVWEQSAEKAQKGLRWTKRRNKESEWQSARSGAKGSQVDKVCSQESQRNKERSDDKKSEWQSVGGAGSRNKGHGRVEQSAVGKGLRNKVWSGNKVQEKQKCWLDKCRVEQRCEWSKGSRESKVSGARSAVGKVQKQGHEKSTKSGIRQRSRDVEWSSREQKCEWAKVQVGKVQWAKSRGTSAEVGRSQRTKCGSGAKCEWAKCEWAKCERAKCDGARDASGQSVSGQSAREQSASGQSAEVGKSVSRAKVRNKEVRVGRSEVGRSVSGQSVSGRWAKCEWAKCTDITAIRNAKRPGRVNAALRAGVRWADG
ncbi:Histone-lysine N-methyltransferase SETMAR [Eumeta japonica]|uniref:Histone-lysine N-methyltransferase SETMAR n=1 Tax=Eumeta variegata TaxID=151549 RepID=A0A4C1WJS5_EUMVA|nr:Histone-lysine N-methyltransferase SETMAR [Eumeta japonica]